MDADREPMGFPTLSQSCPSAAIFGCAVGARAVQRVRLAVARRWLSRLGRPGAVLLAVVSFAGPAVASWTALGPDGAIGIQALLVDPRAPQRVLAGTSGGLFVSDDGGTTWSRGGFDGNRVNALAADPRHPDIIHAATDDGISTSRDGGRSWAAPIGGDLYEARDVVVHPRRTRVLYTCTSGGVFKSVDAGAHWQRSTAALGYIDVLSLAIDPQRPSIVYAGASSDRPFPGLLKSEDGGATWQPIGDGLSAGAVFALLVDPAQPDTVYAGTDGGVFTSDDGGHTWRAALAPPDLTAYALTLGGDAPGRLSAATSDGVWQSDDRGATWRPTALSGVSISALAVDPTEASRVYAGDGAVFVSSDGGATYERHDAGLGNVRVYAVAVDPTNATRVAAAARSIGVLATADRGQTWERPNPPLFGSMSLLMIDPMQPQRWFAGGGDGWVVRSLDGGVSWRTVGRELPDEIVNAVAIDPRDPDVVYVGLSSTFGSAGLYRSSDGGTSWTAVDAFAGIAVNALVFDLFSPGIYAAIDRIQIFQDSSIARSDDYGETWYLSSDGFDEAAESLVMAADGSLYGAGGLGGLFKSTDGAASWSKLARFTSFIGSTSLAVDPEDSATVYAAGGDVFRTTDGGATWAALDVPYLAALSVAVSPDHQVYVGTYGSGIFRFDPFAPAATPSPSPTAPPAHSAGDSDGCQVVPAPAISGWNVPIPTLLIGLMVIARRRRGLQSPRTGKS